VTRQNDVAAVPDELRETLNCLFEEARQDPSLIHEFKLKLSQYRGPFPPAEILKEYNEVYPGAAQWLLDQTSLQIEHRHALEKRQVDGVERRMDRAQWFGFSIALLAIALASAANYYTGSWIFSIALAAMGVGGPVVGQALGRSVRNWLFGKTTGQSK
jgi:uncharacterized membrane protein